MAGRDGGDVHLTHQGMRVLRAFLANSGGTLYGAEIMAATGLPSGTVYPLLLRYERNGLLSSSWERGNPSNLGRPRRRLYRITALGCKAAEIAFANLGVQPTALPGTA